MIKLDIPAPVYYVATFYDRSQWGCETECVRALGMETVVVIGQGVNASAILKQAAPGPG